MDYQSTTCADDEEPHVPITALRHKSRIIISQLLNSKKVIPSLEGLPRDWRGLAHLTDILLPLGDCPDPTNKILEIWGHQNPTSNIRTLKTIFGRLDRWDVFDDTDKLIDEDIKEYLKRKEDGLNNAQLARCGERQDILTIDDIYRIEQNLEPQIYDAFLLFSDEDEWFARDIVQNLEGNFGLKLCLRDRDLVGGLPQLEAITHLIAKRCNFVIVVISEHFFRSKYNQFFVTFAQTDGIEKGRRKLIPCVYERLNLPSILRPYFILDFSRSQNGQFGNFWEKLSLSVKSTLAIQRTSASASEYNCKSVCKVTEIVEEKNEVRDLEKKLVESRMLLPSMPQGETSILPSPPLEGPITKKTNKPLSNIIRKIFTLEMKAGTSLQKPKTKKPKKKSKAKACPSPS